MPLELLKNVNFGSNRSNMTGSTGVSYQLLDGSGNPVTPAISNSVYQIVPGIYAALISFPDEFHGQILWTCPASGSFSVVHAIEQYNVEENDPRLIDVLDRVDALTGSVQSLVDVSYGRWKIDKTTNRMLLYKADNVTLVAAFDLYDENNNPTVGSVFDRRRV